MASQPGDTVQIAAGVYHEAIDYLGKAITVRGAGPSATTLSGSGLTGSCVTFAAGESQASVLRDLRIDGCSHGTMRGTAALGAAVFCDGAAPLICNCVFSNNSLGSPGSKGGSVELLNSIDFHIRDCSFTSSHAELEGGAVHCDASVGMIVGTTFTQCTSGTVGAGATYSSGGAISAYHGVYNFSDCTITGCQAFYGGGLRADSGNAGVTITRCKFTSNVSVAPTSAYAYEGGGAIIGGTAGAPVNIQDTLFRSNVAPHYGGGIRINGGAVNIVRCDIANNSAAKGGGMSITGASPVVVERTLITGNAATGGTNTGGLSGAYANGGGVSVGAAVTFLNCSIVHNSAGNFGSALDSCCPPPSGSAANLAWNGVGGATATLRNCLVYGNVGPSNAPNPSVSTLEGPRVVSYCDTQDTVEPGVGNISVDPQCCDFSNDMFLLTGSSPCIDAGDPALLDSDGSRSDIGAFGRCQATPPSIAAGAWISGHAKQSGVSGLGGLWLHDPAGIAAPVPVTGLSPGLTGVGSPSGAFVGVNCVAISDAEAGVVFAGETTDPTAGANFATLDLHRVTIGSSGNATDAIVFTVPGPYAGAPSISAVQCTTDGSGDAAFCAYNTPNRLFYYSGLSSTAAAVPITGAPTQIFNALAIDEVRHELVVAAWSAAITYVYTVPVTGGPMVLRASIPAGITCLAPDGTGGLFACCNTGSAYLYWFDMSTWNFHAVTTPTTTLNAIAFDHVSGALVAVGNPSPFATYRLRTSGAVLGRWLPGPGGWGQTTGIALSSNPGEYGAQPPSTFTVRWATPWAGALRGVDSLPFAGNPRFGLSLSVTPCDAVSGYLAVSLLRPPAPGIPAAGGYLQIDPAALIAVAPIAGAGEIAFPLPLPVGLSGLEVYWQALLFHGSDTAWSPGLRLRFD